MGPDVPTRPKFSWDVKNAPWTDGKGPQEAYYKSVVLWKAFHDKLPAANSNKIPLDLQGIILQSQLYGRAIDICKKVSDELIQSEAGALAIAKAIYKCDPLSAITDTFSKFTSVLQTSRGSNETFRNFESRFDAAVCSYNSAAPSAKLPESLVAFILIGNSDIDDNQRVSILSAVAPKQQDNDANIGALLDKITYEDVASIIRSFDKPKASGGPSTKSSLSLNANGAYQRNNRNHQFRRNRTPEELAELKKRTKCNDCGKKGHWKGDPQCENKESDDNRASQDHGTTSAGSSSGIVKTNTKGKANKTGTVSFHMVKLKPESDGYIEDRLGPLVDDGAPYSGMGLQEFYELQRVIMPSFHGVFDPLPDCVADRPFWQYGTGEHSSGRRRIIGSVMLTTLSDQGTPVNIRHLIIQGSSAWVIGRNVTRLTDIIHLNGNFLKFDVPETCEPNTIQLTDHDFHSYLLREKFYHSEFKSIQDPKCSSIVASSASATLSWNGTKKIIKRIHEHVCGHSNYNDIKLLLQRNKIWSDGCVKYLSQLLESCPDCRVVKAPSANRPVSLSGMSSNFNDIVCVDHQNLGDHDVFHAMDIDSRYSAGGVVESTGMEEAIQQFEICWITPFWAPEYIQGDQAFNNDIFKNHLQTHGTGFRPVPPRRHSKNAIESKHRIIRDIYLRLVSANPDVSTKLLVLQAIRVSNDLYGNDVASANELAKGYTRPIVTGSFFHVPDDVRAAHQELIAKRKLNKILRSNAVKDTPVKVGDMVEVFIRLDNQKRGKWSQPKPVLKYDLPSRTVTVSGAKGRYVKAAIEDVRHALSSEHDLAIAVQEAIDFCSQSLEESLDNVLEDEVEESNDSDTPPGLPVTDNEYDDLNYYGTSSVDNENDQQAEDAANNSNDSGNTPEVDQGQEDGCIDALDQLTHVPDVGPAPSTHEMELRERPDIVYSADIELQPGTSLTSSEQEDLEKYVRRFKSKEFLLHQAQGLPTHITENAYATEEDNFVKTCTKVHVSKVPNNANVIGSHVLYKVKELDDGSKICKARIAPHGNKDKEKHKLKKDSAACPPLGFRILLSICTIFHFYVSKVDIKSAFLQSGKATRDVFVVPPRECDNKTFYWLLEVATYGLVNANAKWQNHSDTTFLDMGLLSVVQVPQLFYLMEGGILVLIVAKVVDDILVGGHDEIRKRFIKRLAEVYKIGTIVHLPGSFRFFGLTVEQEENADIRISAEDKLQDISPYTLTRPRRKSSQEPLTSVELYSFQSVNGSLGFLGMTVSPFAAFASSHLQQTENGPTVQSLVHQSNILKIVQRMGSVSTFVRPEQQETLELAVLIFADAGRPSSCGQLGYVGGLLIGPLCHGSIIHTITWASHLSKRPVKSIASAEVLAAGDAIDDGKLIANVYKVLLGIDVHLYVVVDSKDLFSSLSTCRTPEDKSILADVQLLRYNFETHNLNQLIWIPGSANPADPLTKRDSPLMDTLQIMLFDGTLPLDFAKFESRCSDAPLG